MAGSGLLLPSQRVAIPPGNARPTRAAIGANVAFLVKPVGNSLVDLAQGAAATLGWGSGGGPPPIFAVAAPGGGAAAIQSIPSLYPHITLPSNNAYNMLTPAGTVGAYTLVWAGVINSTAQYNFLIARAASSGSYNNPFELRTNNGSTQVQLTVGTASSTGTSSTVGFQPVVGKFCVIVVVATGAWGSSGVSIYVNGNLAGNTFSGLSTAPAPNTQPMYFGTRADLYGYANTNMALAAGYARAFTPSEVAAVSANPAILFDPGLLLVPFGTGGGGAVWSVSMSESCSAADSIGNALAAAVSMAESGAATDTVSTLAQYVAAISEAGSASDATTAAGALIAAIAESGAAADTSNYGSSTISVAMAESGAAADVASALALFGAAVAETGAAADASTVSAILAASLAESGAAADIANWGGSTISAAISEAGSATDAAAVLAVFAVAALETGAATDSTSAKASFLAAMTEAGSAADMAALLQSYTVAIAEAGNAVDMPWWVAAVMALSPSRLFIEPIELRTFAEPYESRTWTEPS